MAHKMQGVRLIEFPITLTATCVLGIAYAGLSVAVGRQRGRANVSLGYGSDLSIAIGEEYKAPPLLVAIRRHAQFAEYVPISLVLLLALELNHANRVMLAGLAAMLVVSRTCMGDRTGPHHSESPAYGRQPAAMRNDIDRIGGRPDPRNRIEPVTFETRIASSDDHA